MLRAFRAIDELEATTIGNHVMLTHIVIALRRGRLGHRTVAVDAHLDTVFPEGTDVSVRRRDDALSEWWVNDNQALGIKRALLIVMADAGLDQ